MNRYRRALREELMNRARIYAAIYRELSKELGEDRAVALMKKAIYERGREKGRRLSEKVGKPDLKKLAAAFVKSKEDVDVFGHEVVEVDEDHALLRLNQCPLVEAWDEMGLSPEDKKRMCDFAYQVDFGKFETAGYKLKFQCRIAEGRATCDMHLTK